MMDQLMQFAGRLHPILVHFPIALVLVAAMIEVARAAIRRPSPSRTSINMLAIGVVSSATAIGSGWLNADYEHGSGSTTLELHRWIAIGGGSAALVALLLGIGAKAHRGMTAAFRAVLVVASGAIGFAGHLGGSMVYGEEYLLAPFKSKETPSAPAPSSREPSPTLKAATISFDRDVLPVFVARCAECHGPTKAKGGLRLDSLAHATDVDDWIIAPGDPEGSDLVVRISVPEDEEGAMPPKGQRLTEAQVHAVRVWIESLAMQGSPEEPPPLETSGDGAGDGVKGGATAEPAREEERDASLSESHEESAAIDSLRKIGAHVQVAAADSEMLDVNLSLAGNRCDDQAIELLGPIAHRVLWLRATGSGVTDRGVEMIASCARVERLDLSGTALTNEGLQTAAALPALRALLITGTRVGDHGIEAAAWSPSVRRVYAWGTQITDAGVAALAAAHSEIEFVLDAPSAEWASPESPKESPNKGP